MPVTIASTPASLRYAFTCEEDSGAAVSHGGTLLDQAQAYTCAKLLGVVRIQQASSHCLPALESPHLLVHQEVGKEVSPHALNTLLCSQGVWHVFDANHGLESDNFAGHCNSPAKGKLFERLCFIWGGDAVSSSLKKGRKDSACRSCREEIREQHVTHLVHH